MEGREDVGNDQKSGRPSTAKTQENVEKVARIVRGDRRLNIRAISELTNINKESVRQILDDDLDMKKMCAKVVQKTLTLEQKEHLVIYCVDTFENIENDPDFFKNVITCDETWIFQYDPETSPLHVSSNDLLIIRRSNCINTASGIVTLSKCPSGAQI